MAELLSTGQAAKRIGVTGKTIRQWIYEGAIHERHVKSINGNWYVMASAVDRIVRKRNAVRRHAK